jgi:hypothetical protein
VRGGAAPRLLLEAREAELPLQLRDKVPAGAALQPVELRRRVLEEPWSMS